MEKKRTSIWTTIGVALAIVLLLLWLTFAIWIDDNEASIPHPIEETRLG